MFEKPILNLVKFELEDILTASGEGGETEAPVTDAPTEDPCPAYCATPSCPNDTSEFG